MDSGITAIEMFQRRTISGLEIRNAEISNLELQIKAIKAEQKKLKELESTLAQLLSALGNQLWCESFILLNSDRRIDSHLNSFDPVSGEVIDLVRQEVASNSELAISELPSTLPKALEQNGFNLDTESKFPNFKIQNGLIQIEIDRKKREAEIQVRNARKYKISADVSKITEVVKYETNRLNEDYDLHQFMSRIVDTIAKLRTEKKIDGDASVSLEELRLQLDEAIVPKEIFAMRLSDLKKKFPQVFNLEHTRDEKSGLLLPGNSFYVGRISLN
jgi:hypothetical protein